MVLTTHKYKIKKEESGNSNKRSAKKNEGPEAYGITNLVLIVNNWGFVRDTQHDVKVRECQLQDFQVQLKLSSTAFRNSQNPDCEFPYDRQAANFPYESFCQLMRSPLTKSFVEDVRRLYEETEGPFPGEEDEENRPGEGEDENDDDNEDGPAIGAKRSRVARLSEVDEEGEGEQEEPRPEDFAEPSSVSVRTKRNKK